MALIGARNKSESNEINNNTKGVIMRHERVSNAKAKLIAFFHCARFALFGSLISVFEFRNNKQFTCIGCSKRANETE